MKKTLLLSLILFLSLSLAHTQSWRSSNRLYGTSDLSIIASASDSYNNIYLFGYFSGSITVSQTEQIDSRGGRDLFLAKYNNKSELIWIKGIGGSAHEFLLGGICISQDDHIFITGSFQTSLYYSDTEFLESSGFHDIFLAKYSLDGDVIWYRNVGKGQNYQRSTTLAIDTDDNILLAGYFVDSVEISDALTIYQENEFKDYYVAKFEPVNGDVIWGNSLKSIDSDYSGFIYAISASDNNYYMSGVFGDSVEIGNDTIVSETKNYYDTHIFKSDKSGNIEWIRLIKGAIWDYSYTSSIDTGENIYVTGYFNSPHLTVDSTESTTIMVDSSGADYDFYIVKYDSEGTLNWIRVNGGDGKDRLLRSEVFNNELHVNGFFSDTLSWGGIQLTTNGLADQDMFSGILDLDGNYRSANSFGGTNNSEEAGIAVFNTADELYSVMRSNSELLVLGDSIYISTTGFDYIVVGVTGCLPISIDNVISQDVSTCFGDSTGSIQVLAAGGFGAPWQYSIDNGLSYSDIAYFADLPAGDYPIVVIDKEGCTQPGPLETLSQPDTFVIESVTAEDITADADGSIVVVVSGGSSPYTYTLQPDGGVQGIGTFTFAPGEEGSYVVEVNDLQNCGPVSTETIEILNTVGVDYPSIWEAKVYPNPSSGLITLEMPFEGTECVLEVLSLTGQVMISRQVFSNGGVINESIDLSDLSKGMYMLRVDGQMFKSGIVLIKF